MSLFSFKPLQIIAALLMVSSAHAVTVRVANQGDALSMDPHSMTEAVQLAFLNNVFESLVTCGKDLKIIPSLATSGRAAMALTCARSLRR